MHAHRLILVCTDDVWYRHTFRPAAMLGGLARARPNYGTANFQCRVSLYSLV